MNSKYDKIIQMDHHQSKVHKQMSLSDRAAQFAPFAALTGYEDLIKEFGIVFDDKIELSENQMEEINNTLCKLEKNDEVTVKIYRDDFYLTIDGKLNKIDEPNRLLFVDNEKISFDEIVNVFKS